MSNDQLRFPFLDLMRYVRPYHNACIQMTHRVQLVYCITMSVCLFVGVFSGVCVCLYDRIGVTSREGKILLLWSFLIADGYCNK